MIVWIVFFRDTPNVFLSVHSTEEKAREAVIEYVNNTEYFGGKETDYIIESQPLDFVLP